MCVCDMLWSHAAHAPHSAPCCIADQKSLRWHAQIMRHSRPSQAAIPMHGVQRAYCPKIDDSVWHVRAGPSRGCRGARAARARLEHRLCSRLSKEIVHECLMQHGWRKSSRHPTFAQETLASNSLQGARGTRAVGGGQCVMARREPPMGRVTAPASASATCRSSCDGPAPVSSTSLRSVRQQACNHPL